MSGISGLRTQSLSDQERLAFQQELSKRSKSVGVAYLLWFLFGWHYAYVSNWGTQVLFWITGGGFLVWWLVNLARVPGIIARYNDEVADGITLQIEAMRKA